MLIKEADKRTGLLRAISKVCPESREKIKIEHTIENMLKQRVYGIALGYEDLNDHDHLRKCPGLQTAVGRTKAIASASTLCRFENRTQRDFIVKAHEIIVDDFIRSYKAAPNLYIA